MYKIKIFRGFGAVEVQEIANVFMKRNNILPISISTATDNQGWFTITLLYKEL